MRLHICERHECVKVKAIKRKYWHLQNRENIISYQCVGENNEFPSHKPIGLNETNYAHKKKFRRIGALEADVENVYGVRVV